MAFTKITAAGIGSTETVTLDGVSVINNESIGGNLTVTGNATIGGVLTYEDVTNVDSVGVITARAGVLVGSGITLSKDGDGFYTGIVTATSVDINGGNITLGDSGGASDDRLVLGAGSDLSIFHNGTNSVINNANGQLLIQTDSDFKIEAADGGNDMIHANATGSVELHHNGAKKIETAATGINPSADSTDDIGTNTIRWRNVYADTFYGDGSNLTGITGVTINNNANNRLVTATGTTGTLDGEATLTFTNSGSAGSLNLKRTTSSNQETIFYYGSGGLEIETRESTPIYLKTNQQPRLFITSAGLIGIGPGTPDQDLHIKKQEQSPYVKVESTHSSSTYTGINLRSPTLNFQIWNQGPGATGYSGSNSVVFWQAAATGPYAFYHGNDERLRITSGGNVRVNSGVIENAKTISSNYTVSNNYNAISAGPMSVASGVSVTVPSGSAWTIV